MYYINKTKDCRKEEDMVVEEEEEEGEMKEEFYESFQMESQLMNAVESIEKKHGNKNINQSIGDETMAAFCKEYSFNSSSNKSQSSRSRNSRKSLEENLKKPTNMNFDNSPLFASTPTSSQVKPQFVAARKLIETSEEFQEDRTEVKEDPPLPAATAEPDTMPVMEKKKLELAGWGLPEVVVESYQEKGIRYMFPWQVECLTVDSGAVLSGQNLVYSAPTSAGKTLVAEILLMKRVFETGKKALMILPFVSLAREKMFHLQGLLRDAGIRVEGFMGSQSPAGGLKAADVGVATIEKANSLINRLIEDGQLSTLSCVVVDELHMLGDQSRGYLLELLLTKILYVAGDSVQIIGMSATLPNLCDLSRWLRGSLYTTDYRPVPLTELVKIGTTLLSTALSPVSVVSPLVRLPQDTDHVTWLCLQTVLQSHSVLLFCPNKNWVEKLADTVATDFFSIGRPDPEDRDPDSVAVREGLQAQLNGENLSEVLEQLNRCPAGLDRSLARVIRMGVAFHHAGLTTDERDIVEAGFKTGAIRVLVATSTLSSGVNLPARRVILRSPLDYKGAVMEKLQYKQMVGRAGRKGVDTEGESILICKPTEKEKVARLVTGETERVVSCLAVANTKLAGSMKRALLEVIVSGAAESVLDVERYAASTLLATQLSSVSVTDCIQFLLDAQFIKLQESRYVPTRLGLACLASSLAPDEGLSVYAELSKARKQFVLENELHIIYLIVPLYAAVSWPKLDWMGFLNMWEELSEDMKRVGALVGVEERWMVRAMRGTVRMADPEQRKCLAIHQRFYTALALHDLVSEMPLPQVAEKFGATKGTLQSLQQAASTFSGMVTVFCDRLGWTNLELLIGQFQSRLEFGVQRELVDLCKLLSVDGARARMLYDAGIVSVASLAASNAGEVENILHTNTAFGGKEETDGEAGRRSVKNIFIVGLPPMTEEECSKLMVKEARSVLTRDLGISEAAWMESRVPKDNQRKLKTPQDSKVKIPTFKSRSISGGGRKRRKSNPLKISPHTKYELDNRNPTSLTKNIQLESKSNEIKTDLPSDKQSPIPKKVDVSIDVSKEAGITADKEEKCEVLPPVDNCVNEEEEDMFNMTGMSESFDMSSVMENIFVNEIVTGEDTLKKKKVSWGDEKDGELCDEKKMTPQSQQDEEDESPKKSEQSFVPKTPKFKVCSEDLDLHWSDSESESVSIIEDNNTSDDVFGESISESVLNAVMKQDEKQQRNFEMSEGMLMAVNGMDSHFNLTDCEVVDTSYDGLKSKKRKLTQLDEASSSNVEDIFNDSDIEEGEGQLCVVDICTNREVFDSFKAELEKESRMSLAVAVTRFPESFDRGTCRDVLIVEHGLVVGLAVSCSPLQCFYLQFYEDPEEHDSSLTPPEDDDSISFEERLSVVKSLISRRNVTVAAADFKTQASLLYSVTGQLVSCNASDPLVASWLLNPTATPATVNKLLLEESPHLANLLTTLGSASGYGSVSANPAASHPARYRAVGEAVVVNILDSKMRSKLGELVSHYEHVEMNCQKILLKMELAGMGINEREYEDTKLLLEARLRIIEDEAYRLAGRHFSLSSPPDICKVLYNELKMPLNGDPKLSSKPGRYGRNGPKASASKDILEKLILMDYKLPELILEYRRLSSAISKTVGPLLSVCQPHPVLSSPRVYSRSITVTATGRVSLQEPNLQNIPRDFSVELTDELRKKALGRRSSRNRMDNTSLALTPLSRLLSPLEPSTTVSLRLAVTPAEGNLLLSAGNKYHTQLFLTPRLSDYSQLELRILAHLSADPDLIQTLREGTDVFRTVAAQINDCELDEVTDTMRQQAKQVVYGVIYGMGEGSLAEQLGMEVIEAGRFMDNFKLKYKKVRDFLNESKASAKRTGYVETLSGRRRQLEDINHSNQWRSGAAERQAVNTRVQGSAADLVKTAMVQIDRRIEEVWPSCRPLKFCNARGRKWRPEELTGAWLVLQLHDELIYEVSGEDVLQAALIVKEGMEEALELRVPTPVRVKVGANWGELQDFHISN